MAPTAHDYNDTDLTFQVFYFNLKMHIDKIQFQLTRSHQPKFDWEEQQMVLVIHSCIHYWTSPGQDFEEVQILSQKSLNHLDPVVVESQKCTYSEFALLQQL